MQSSNNLNQIMASVPPEQMMLLSHCISGKNWAPIIEFAQAKVLSFPETKRPYMLHEIYKFVIDFALSIQAYKFVEEVLSQPTVLQYLDHSVLLHYSQNKSVEFQKKVLIALINNPSHRDVYSFNAARLSQEFVRQATEVIAQIRSNEQEINDTLLKLVLLNDDIAAKQKNDYLNEWINCIFLSLRKNSKPDLNEVFIMLTCYLPLDQENIVHAIHQIVYAHSNNNVAITLAKRIAHEITPRNKLSEEIALENIKNISDVTAISLCFPILRSNFAAEHPVHQLCCLVETLINSDASDRAAFIVKNPEVLTSAYISDYFKYKFINKQLSKDDKKYILELYLNDSNLKYGELFSQYIFLFEDDFVKRFLTCSHTVINTACVEEIFTRNSPRTTEFIIDILNRGDFSIASILPRLAIQLNNGDRVLVTQILNHPNTYAFFKKYYKDDYERFISSDDRGSLMASVLAWYVQTGKFQELFATIPEEKQKYLLKVPVASIIDPDQANLNRFIVRSGDQVAIQAIGGKEPRLVKMTPQQYIAYAPSLWRKPYVLEKMRSLQRKVAVNIARKKLADVTHFTISELARNQAQVACKNIQAHPLVLLHQSYAENSNAILKDGILKTRLHISSHSVMGKKSKGLMGNNVILNKQAYYCYFTRKPLSQQFDAGISQFNEQNQFGVEINGQKMLADNKHINYLVISACPDFSQKILELPGGIQFAASPFGVAELANITQIDISSASDIESIIKQKLLEIVFERIVSAIPEPTKAEVIAILLNPKTVADHELIAGLFDLLQLEWLIPSDVRLRLSYVDAIYVSDKRYDIAAMRRAITESSEPEILTYLDKLDQVERSPFILNGILKLALQKGQRLVVKKLLQMQDKTQQQFVTAYYPSELYQIESLAQLILEDFDNSRIYAHLDNNLITLHSILMHDTNRGGAHHAEMSKLHYALNRTDVENKNARGLLLSDTVNITVGADSQFKNLAQVRDALLSYEVTTLLTSYQNYQYYLKNGKIHPQTGKGATNGGIALLKNRLFIDDIAYQINCAYNETGTVLTITSTSDQATKQIVSALSSTLNIAESKFQISANSVNLQLSASDLIAKLRQRAVCYEGLNVMTEEGRILLASRHSKGLASAGGHHGDKYHPVSVAHGLQSEFGLMFAKPAEIEGSVKVLKEVKTISKTGIFAIPSKALIPTEATAEYSKQSKHASLFKADPAEFDSGSETALNLTEMRGKAFYDVMPLAELCHFQLQQLKDYLFSAFPEMQQSITFSIDTSVSIIMHSGTPHKVPAPVFGSITISSSSELPEQLQSVFANNAKRISTDKLVYETDENPLVLLQALQALNKQRLQV